MINIQSTYIEKMKETICDLISKEIKNETLDQIVSVDIVETHLNNQSSARFQSYYFEILKNEEAFYQADFFRNFKSRYGLQGIDNNFLNQLNSNKKDILKQIREDNLIQLYYEYFKNANIQYRERVVIKELGSFFAKLVHTFRPDDYCALDNPIKKYFGLKNEGFFISFVTISSAYKYWASNNSKLIETLRDNLSEVDNVPILNHENLTDMKLLDLIFWSKAKRLGV